MNYAKRAGVVGVIAWALACCVPASGASLRAWGLDQDGQVTKVPTGNDYVAVAAGAAHGLALRADGTVVAWGRNSDGECNVPAGKYKAIGAGADFSLAVRTDGSLAAWGNNRRGQVTGLPRGNDYVAVDGGEFFAVARKADGSLVAWGHDRWGQVSGAPQDKGFTAVVAGDDHAVALRTDGSLVAWGYWAATDSTPLVGTYTALSAGGAQSLALRTDGSIAWWGADAAGLGLSRVPAGNDYTAVAAGYLHGLALKRDGSVVGWGAGTTNSGQPHWGQASPPAGNKYLALACGLYFSVALTSSTDVSDDSGGDGNSGGTAGISDDFNDNRRGDLWQLQGEDLLNCWLDEVNQRLELRATSKATGLDALYVADDWRIDPGHNFSLRVDFHFGTVTDRAGWLVLGLTPDVNDLHARYVKLEAGCDRQYPYFWYEAIDGKRKQSGFVERRANDGTLYMSYDAAMDTLYLSTVGFGVKEAWAAIPGVLQGSWRATGLRVFLGGGAEGMSVNSGDAYLDNLRLESGNLIAAGLRDVYSFWSPALERRFYTIDTAERDLLIDKYSAVWTFEGAAFRAGTTAVLQGMAPVYRLWSAQGLDHFYTAEAAEKDTLVRNYPDVWSYEGVAFYAWPVGQQPKEARPVYRLYRGRDNSHVYTTSETEKENLLRDFSRDYIFEGVAFYAGGL
jgi:alpha-tubulin suppressor-like RCC1 family protein